MNAWLALITGGAEPFQSTHRVWVPNWPSTAMTCGIDGQWPSGMIVARGGTTVLLWHRGLVQRRWTQRRQPPKRRPPHST
jgi:hypothetical protein